MASTLTAAEAAHRLGIKVPSLYAYVSRGTLISTKSADGRTSRFDAEEIAALARRGRPRRATRPTAVDFTLETRITGIVGHRVLYRGRDSSALARSATFEQVAGLLWTGSLAPHPPVWTGGGVVGPDGCGPVDRVRVVTALAGAADPLRGDLRPEAVAATGALLLATLVDALPLTGDGRTPRLSLPAGGPPVRGTIAGRLWGRLAGGRPRPGLLAALNAALVLVADHEIAPSTLAARVAASTRADPYAVVGAGLGAMAGPLHGGASRLARRLLDDAASVGPAAAVADSLARTGTCPGFGHPLYPDGDPRAVALLDLLQACSGGTAALRLAEEVAATVRRRAPLEPNVDYALATLGLVSGMPEESGEIVFTLGRIAGWLAHALEEYGEAPLRFRPRALYVG